MQRTAGVLLHPTCLPSVHGIGDIGPAAHAYIRWLASAGASWWQVLPLHPPGPGFSPYSAISTFAGSPWLISPDALVEDGLLNRRDLDGAPSAEGSPLVVDAALPWKSQLLRRAWHGLWQRSGSELMEAFAEFGIVNGWWLHDFALFAALKEAHGGAAWTSWPDGLDRRDLQAIVAARTALVEEIEYQEFCQFLFFRQWRRLREVAKTNGVKILGDMPIFVSLDSADVWARPELFLLDAERRPLVVAGVPPDYFSETGQLWGNPLYDWDQHREDGFSWWVARTCHALELADAVRLDHFRGFVACWEVPADETTAIHGRWAPGPGRELFERIEARIGSLPLVAEDLGEITPEVVDLRRGLGLPGMAILQFGFSPEARSSFIPYHHRPDLVVYTGTHDNNTSVGWYENDATDPERDLLRRYAACDGSEIHWDLIRLALSSVGDVAIVPHQDLLGLGARSRMNTPGVAHGNWTFRISPEMMGEGPAARFRTLAETYGRVRQ